MRHTCPAAQERVTCRRKTGKIIMFNHVHGKSVVKEKSKLASLLGCKEKIQPEIG